MNREQWTKVGKGALIALSGALLTYIATIPEIVDFGDFTPFVAAGLSVLVNAGRKWVESIKK